MNTLHPAPQQRRYPRRLAGFSMVEILVGVAIAMVGTVIMLEVLLTSDQRNRTSTAGNDAMTTGAVMMHLMQRDVVQAGYGLSSPSLLGCSVTLPTGATVPVAPVTINPPTALVPAGDANTDRLLVMYGSDSGEPEGQEVVAIAGSAYTVRAPATFANGDYVLGTPTPCAGTVNLARVTGKAGFNVSVDSVNALATSVYNLGTPRIVAYAVRNGSLSSCDFLQADCRVVNAANWTAVAGNIVSLRAQYGRDTAPAGSMDRAIDVWDQTTPATACQWARTPALRFALVARSTQYETKIDTATQQRVCDTVTSAASPSLLWAGSTGASTAPIDLSAAADWQCYRYKAFETVAPTRNTVWMRAPSGC